MANPYRKSKSEKNVKIRKVKDTKLFRTYDVKVGKSLNVRTSVFKIRMPKISFPKVRGLK